ncbi:hypothetical protein F4677DRAFT_463223 [Hypoxylon crocopeplum]|nr:hypothetical protein F4677DRAFT_463223 [Hypoxylon crocopeplum]
MSRENSHDASELGRVPDEATGAHSQTFSGQIDLIQPCEDSQETIHNATVESPTVDHLSQGSQPVQLARTTYFTRPDIETTEEIAAGFQYQKAPHPRNRTHGLAGQQKNQSIALPPSAPRASQHGQALGILKSHEDNSRVEPLPSSSYEGDGRDVINFSYGNGPADAITNSYKASRDTVRDRHLPLVNTSDQISGKVSSSFPFPEETSTPRISRRKHISPLSTLDTNHLPKSISNAGRKARAVMSPHFQPPRQKTILSPSQNHQRQRGQLSSTQSEEAPINLQRRPVHRSTREVDATPSDIHLDRVDHNSNKHRKVERQKKQELTRPMLVECPEDEPPPALRSHSRASNISKPRAPPKSHHQRGSPSRAQNSLNIRRLAESWNSNSMYNKKLLDSWEHKIAMMEDHIAAQSSDIEQYQEDIQSRDQVIDGLSKEVENLRAQSQKVQDEIAASSTTRDKLKEKLRICKDRLNDAIHEQQRLFLLSKENYQNVTTAMIAESQEQKTLVEEASTTTERVRAKLEQEVATVVKDTKIRVEELSKTIGNLENRLREREKDLEHEREHADDLTKQLTETHELNEQSLQSLAAQNQELLEKMKQSYKQAENTEICIQKQDEKIDTILKALEETRLKTLDPVALMENIEDAHNNAIATIVAEVQGSAESSGNSLNEGQAILNENIGDIRVVCEGLYERMASADDVSRWQQSAHESSMTVQNQVHQIQGLQDELHQLHIQTTEQSEQQRELKRQLSGLEVAASNEQAANEKINNLEVQVRNFQMMLTEKDTVATSSNEELKMVQEELKAQARTLQDKEKQIENERQKHKLDLESIIQQREQAILHAVTKVTEELSEQRRDTQERLRQANEAGAQLQQELAKARQASEVQIQANIDEDLHQIRGEMAVAINSITKLTADLAQSEPERDALQGNLLEWSRDRIEIDQMQQILGRLARSQPNTIQMNNQLKELLEIQKKLSGTLEYHEAQLASTEASLITDQSLQDGETATTSGDGYAFVENQRDEVARSTEELRNSMRRVVVKSPVTEDGHVSPMSVDQEKSVRRRSVPRRGIMKVATPSTYREIDADRSTLDADAQPPVAPQPPAKRKIANRGSKTTLTTHSMYNRPVAGSVAGTSKGQVDTSQASSHGYRSDAAVDGVTPDQGKLEKVADLSYEISESDDMDENPMKRQRTLRSSWRLNRESHVTESQVIPSASKHFPAQSAEDLESTEKITLEPKVSLSRGHLKRKSSSSRSPGYKQSHSQSLTTSDIVKTTDSQSTIASSQTIKMSDSQD